MRPIVLLLSLLFLSPGLTLPSQDVTELQYSTVSARSSNSELAPSHTHQLNPRQYFPISLAYYYERLCIIGGIFTLALPTSIIAVKSLGFIYQKILDTLLDAWAKNPGRNQMVVEAGNLRWEFGCTMTPFPYEFLKEYYESKRDAVGRGFLPVYEREWVFNRTDRA
ncbi:MAG: hypothetical protein Q9198_002091, partial [Flavoplaca austrocitrina]